jgi:16S rRNA (adenine(1408)-N(1))-methyltransferase
VIDVGAGDGLASIRLARAEPSTFAIALDPSVDRLRIGARTALRQKIANALFVVAPIEDAPCELDGAADEITISFPWGSLLRGIVRADAMVLAPLARLAKFGARINVVLSIEDRDAATDLTPLEIDEIADRCGAFAAAGLIVEDLRAASPTESARTTWGRRLARGRAAHLLTLRRAP